MQIQRQVHIKATPLRVGAALGASPYRHAFRIVAAGAGARVLIEAEVEPAALAESIESEAIAVVCTTKRRLEQVAPGALESTQIAAARSTTGSTTRRKKTMTTITRSVSIEASNQNVWRALADFGAISRWNPNVKQSHLTSDQGGGLGATRECQLAPMGVVQERITTWEEGRLMGVDIYEHKRLPGMRSATATIELTPMGEQTVVSMTIDYTIGLGALGSTMNALGMKRQFNKAVAGLLAGLKHHVETGDEVDGKTKLPLGAVSAAA